MISLRADKMKVISGGLSVLMVLVLMGAVTQIDWIQGIKNKPTVDVRVFGAKCDSSHNDYQNITDAISSMTNGGTLEFPIGTCTIGHAVTLPANIYFRGQGQNQTILKQTVLPSLGSPYTNMATIYDVVTITGGNSGISNMTLRGSAGTSPLPVANVLGQKCLTLQPVSPASYYLIENVTVEQCQTNAVQVWTGANYATFRNIRVLDTGNEGFITFAANFNIDGVYLARLNSWGLDIDFGNSSVTHFTCENVGSTTYFFDGGCVDLNPDPRWGGPEPANISLTHGNVINSIGVGITLAIPLVGNTISNLILDDITVTSTNRTNMSQGLNSTTGGGSFLGTLTNVTMSHITLNNVNASFQNMQLSNLDHFTVINTIPVSGDTFATWGIDMDTGVAAFGLNSISNSTLAGWDEGINWHSCYGGCSSMNNTGYNNNVVDFNGFGIQSSTPVANIVPFTSTGDHAYSAGGSVFPAGASKINYSGADSGTPGGPEFSLIQSMQPDTAFTGSVGYNGTPYLGMFAEVFECIDNGGFCTFTIGYDATDGTWKIRKLNTGLEFQKRVSGTDTNFFEILPGGGVAMQSTTYAGLPTCGALGMTGNTCFAFITDAATNTWGANVTTGGGSNKVFVGWNGTNWTVMGK